MDYVRNVCFGCDTNAKRMLLEKMAIKKITICSNEFTVQEGANKDAHDAVSCLELLGGNESRSGCGFGTMRFCSSYGYDILAELSRGHAYVEQKMDRRKFNDALKRHPSMQLQITRVSKY